MIEYKTGDILQDDAEALVNTVNCVGVMGRGIALQFKHKFPENFIAYAEACRREQVKPGKMFIHETDRLTPPRYIINFPTKRHWRQKSSLADIEAGLDHLVTVIRHHGIRSLAIPPLGSGLGGLNWSDVRDRIESTLSVIADVRVTVYEPIEAQKVTVEARAPVAPRMTIGRAVLVELMQRYLAGHLDPFITLLEVHKLMYFMQEAGEPLRLRFQRAPYGPYAENLRHVLAAIEGHLIKGYADGGDDPGKALEVAPRAMQSAAEVLSRHPATVARLESVAGLVEGFESPYGLELLSSVHWVVTRENVTEVGDVIQRTHGWNERKRRFTPRQIGLAVDVLQQKGWVNRPSP